MLKVFAVFDAKAAAYGAPVFLATRGMAIRAFEDASADPRSPACQHPSDYTLHELGEFDPCSGKLTALDQPVFVISAAEIVEARVQARLKKEPLLPGVEVVMK